MTGIPNRDLLLLQLLSQHMQMLSGLVWLVCVLGCVVWSDLDGLVCKLGTTFTYKHRSYVIYELSHQPLSY